MGERIEEISPKQGIRNYSSQISSLRFFEEYSRVAALSKVANQPGQAIEFFNDAKKNLEERLTLLRSISPRTKEIEQQISLVHGLLAMVYWLCPTESGFDREEQAAQMFDYVTIALDASQTEMSESLAICLFIQLRVLCFLVASKKYTITKMKKARHRALVTSEILSRRLFTTKIPRTSDGWSQDFDKFWLYGFLGILYDGLGFSYYRIEGDFKTALAYFHKSVDYFQEARNSPLRKSVTHELKGIESVRMFLDCFAALANFDLGLCYETLCESSKGEDMLKPNKQARDSYLKGYELSKRTPWHVYSGLIAYDIGGTYWRESSLQTDKGKVQSLLEKAVIFGKQGFKFLSLWSPYDRDFVGGSLLATFYLRLASVSEPDERKNLIAVSLELAQKASMIAQETGLSRYMQTQLSGLYYYTADSYYELANNTKDESLKESDSKEEVAERTRYLEKSFENCAKSLEYFGKNRFRERVLRSYILLAKTCLELINSDLDEKTKREFTLVGMRYCRDASRIASKMGWNESIASTQECMARFLDKVGKFEASALHFAHASEAYRLLRDDSKNGTKLYEDLHLYMHAWERIERAKQAHSSSKFDKASNYYEEACKLLSQSTRWKTQAQLFLAESLLEKVEILSLKDETSSTIDLLEQSKLHLSRFLAESKKKETGVSFAFHDLASSLIVFSQARIFLENSKEFYRRGDVENSNEGLRKAGKSFEELASKNLLSDLPRLSELGSMSLLCSALEKFQRAPIEDDPRLYLIAKETFEKASELTTSKFLKPLLLGLANFSAFLFDSREAEKSLESAFRMDILAKCDEELDNAAGLFKKVGNASLLNMLRGGKHFLEARIKMSAAEREVQRSDVRADLYSKAKRSLSLASKYFGLAGSSKLNESMKVIDEMKSQQRLFPLAHDIIAEIASNQIIYTAIAESSVIKQPSFESDSDVDQPYVLIEHEFEKTFVTTSETAKLTFTLSNISRESCTALRIDEAIPDDFEIVDTQYKVSDGHSIVLNEKLEPNSSILVKLSCQANALGEFVWRPTLLYTNFARKYKVSRSQTAQRVIVESSSPEDFHLLVEEKKKLQKILENSQIGGTSAERETESLGGRVSGEISSLKERIAEIDEKFYRVKYELEQIKSDLRRIDRDLALLESNPESVEREEKKIDLENERELLIETLERRQALLKQVQSS